MARFGSASRIGGLFSRFSSIRLKREPDTLALASRRSNRVVASDVQLQPVWWSALRGVWLARISASPFARDNAALGRRNMLRRHVGSVARTALRCKLEQFSTVDIHPDRGRIINTDGICVQFIRARGSCGDPYALRVQCLIKVHRSFSRRYSYSRTPFPGNVYCLCVFDPQCSRCALHAGTA